MTKNETITPEVGQVWKWKNNSIYIVNKCELYGKTIGYRYLCKSEDGLYFIHYCGKEVFEDYCTYIGKAKGSISDLFEIENVKN